MDKFCIAFRGFTHYSDYRAFIHRRFSRCVQLALNSVMAIAWRRTKRYRKRGAGRIVGTIMPVLLVKVEQSVKIYEMPEGMPVLLGSTDTCEISIPFPTVSRRHAAFVFKNGICAVKDLNSFNGTFVNGKRITRPTVLNDGDTVRIANFFVRFKRERPGQAKQEPEPAASSETATLRPVTGENPQPPADVESLIDDINPAIADDGTDSMETQAYISPNIDSARLKAAPIAPIPPAGEAESEPENVEAEAVGGDTGTEETIAYPENPEEEEEFDLSRYIDSYPGSSMPEYDPAKIGEDLSKAIETRLRVFSLLDDLAEERRFFRMSSRLPEEVLTELGRQDREYYVLPLAEQVEKNLLEYRHLSDGPLEEAGDAAADGPHPPSPEMLKAEEMALSQWLLLSESNRSNLPQVFRSAYALMADEPLAKEFRDAQIRHMDLLGGAAYLLTLQKMLADAQENREQLKAQIAATEGEGAASSIGKLFRNLTVSKAEKGRLEKLHQDELAQATRGIWLEREIKFMDQSLIREFWNVYTDAAIHFVPSNGNMQLPVRAFLRFGAISFNPWWMREETKKRIIAACSGTPGKSANLNGDGGIVYADEYLAAVADTERTPAPDDRIAALGTDSPEWKADRAFRRMINGCSYLARLRGVRNGIIEQIAGLNREMQACEARLAELSGDAVRADGREEKLQEQIYLLRERKKHVEKLAKILDKNFIMRVRDRTEAATERFHGSSLPLPTPRYLIRRECETFADIARRMSDNRERFISLAIRDSGVGDENGVAVRPAVRTLFDAVEERDPDIFTQTLIPANKKSNRVVLRHEPSSVILPCLGATGYCADPREGTEGGHLFLPCLSARQTSRQRQVIHLLADYRWLTAAKEGGRDLSASDTLAGAFMRVRGYWRNFAKPRRERGLIFSEQPPYANWRRVYEFYVEQGADKFRACNQDLYIDVFGKYFESPEAE